MIKLLVIADDFTGALDTGVQFRAKGTVLHFGKNSEQYFSHLNEDINVLIIDSETRHLPAEEAGAVIFDIVQQAVQSGVKCIYKKTDSGLRGNIGSELAAALKASGRESLHFIPAYPQLGRTTRGGIHYINDVPVAESVFGADPFEPVRHSDVGKIIAAQTDVQTSLLRDMSGRKQGICVYDAESEEDLRCIADSLKQHDELHLLAGCAGFAAVLPDLLELERTGEALPTMCPKLLTVCGSINRITLEQLDAAEEREVPRIRLNTRQKLEEHWQDSWEGKAVLAAWAELVKNNSSTIIECNGLGNPGELEEYRKEMGLDLEQMRCRISDTMAGILKSILDRGLDATLLVTGGDTLMAFMRLIGQHELVPILEITSGVVLSQFHYKNKLYNLLSKSGGFGGKNLLAEIEEVVLKNAKEEVIC